MPAEDHYAMHDAVREGSPAGPGWRRSLNAALRDRRAAIGVVGLGYVGLPMLVSVARAGFRAVGVDVDRARVDALQAGRSYIGDVPDGMLADLAGTFRASTNRSALRACDVVLICVPTPLADHDPDLRFIERAAADIAAIAAARDARRPGVHDVPGDDRGGPASDPRALGTAGRTRLRPGVFAGADRPRARARPHREDPPGGRRADEGRRRARGERSTARSSTRSSRWRRRARPRWPS